MTSTRKLLALPLLIGSALVGFTESAAAHSYPIEATGSTVVSAPAAEVRPGDPRPTSLYGGSCHQHQMVDLDVVTTMVLTRSGSTAAPYHVRWEGYGYLDAGGPIREHLDISTIPAGQRSIEVELPALEGTAQLEPHTWRISISETPEYDWDITVHGFTAADPGKDAPCEFDGDDVIEPRRDDDVHLLDHLDVVRPPHDVISEDRDGSRPGDEVTGSGGGGDGGATVSHDRTGDGGSARLGQDTELAGGIDDSAAPGATDDAAPVAALGVGGAALAGAAGALAWRRRIAPGER